LPSYARAIVHLNVADFAAAVERLCQPGLKGRPLIVAPGGAARALVYDMSQEAFAHGVRKRMPLERARRLCRDARVVAPSPHHYEKAMRALWRRAQPWSPLVEAEPDSGHLFLDLTGTTKLFGPPQDVAWRIRRDVRRELGLDPIWTLAPNKLLAKAASRVVKPDGECVIAPGQEEAFLQPLAIHLLPGLELRDLITLRELNVRQVGQAAVWTPEHLETIFGRRGEHLRRLLHGHDDTPVLPAEAQPARLMAEHAFPEDTNEDRLVDKALFILAERLGADLRRLGRAARRLGLTLVHSDGLRVTRARTLPEGTANDFLLFDLARAALANAWTRRVRLRHLRLACDRLGPPPVQMELCFSETERKAARRDDLMTALDHIRQCFGPAKIQVGRVWGEG
jgi:DNA polymerase IV